MFYIAQNNPLQQKQQKFQLQMSMLPKLKILFPSSFLEGINYYGAYNSILFTTILCCFNSSFSTLYTGSRMAYSCKP